jgi:3-oxoadipate enol-lactonase
MRLHRERRGDGPPLLLIHAGGLDGRMYGPLADRLEDRLSLVIPDLRGHGRTGPSAEPFAHAEDLVALLDELELEHVAVAGTSFGGWVALELVALAPERVSALVLLASNYDVPDEQRSPELLGFWEREEELLAAGDIDGAVELGRRTWVREPAIGDLVDAMARASFEYDLAGGAEARELSTDLAAIAVPTLVVSGGLDLPDFPRIADLVAAGVPGAERAEVADAGHLIALERPDAAAALIGGFLERVGP